MIEANEVVGIPRQKWEPAGMSRRGDEQVCEAAAGLSVSSSAGGVDEAIGAGGGSVEGNRVEAGFDLLEAPLPAGSLLRILGGVRAGGKLGQRDGAHRAGLRKGGKDGRVVKVDDD